MKILAIETSCDDTGIAILEVKNKKFTVLSNVVSSQQIHQNYGGVFPMMAKREHQNNLAPVLIESLKQAKLLNPKKQATNTKQVPNSKLQKLRKIFEREENLFDHTKKFLETYEKPNVDYIAVTHGPGLEPCLWVGINFAKALSYIWNIPIIPVNHIEAHIAVNFLEEINGITKSQLPNPQTGIPAEPAILASRKQIRNPKSQISKNLFPAISLVVSGGHTQLILVKGIGKYNIIGETRDDAAGECFDKCAKILGLGYPGGPIISEIAFKANNPPRPIALPRPMINSKDYDFSFSGLKTAVLYAAKDKRINEQYVSEMCVEIQQAIIDVLIKKTLQAAQDFKAKTIILGGGVSANEELRKQFIQNLESRNWNLEFLVPPKNLSTDNALMIAITGYFHRRNKKRWQSMKANANLRVGGK